MQSGMGTLEDILAVSYKSKLLLPYDPEIVLLGIYSQDLKTYVYIKSCTQIFIAAFFIIAKRRKQTKMLFSR